jgi:NDP-sugar pyrophosphorylase family protein
MNGDTFFSGDINLDCNESTIFVAEEEVTNDVGYIHGKDGKVQYFVEKDSRATGKRLVSLGIYKLFKKDLDIPNVLPISMEYDILPRMELSYKIIKTDKFDIGTPERLEKFREWVC